MQTAICLNLLKACEAVHVCLRFACVRTYLIVPLTVVQEDNQKYGKWLQELENNDLLRFVRVHKTADAAWKALLVTANVRIFLGECSPMTLFLTLLGEVSCLSRRFWQKRGYSFVGWEYPPLPSFLPLLKKMSCLSHCSVTALPACLWRWRRGMIGSSNQHLGPIQRVIAFHE